MVVLENKTSLQRKAGVITLYRKILGAGEGEREREVPLKGWALSRYLDSIAAATHGHLKARWTWKGPRMLRWEPGTNKGAGGAGREGS